MLNTNTPTSKSPQITVSSDDLRGMVEEITGVKITNSDAWAECETYAREKLERLKTQKPDADYYNNRYLAVLAAEILNQNAQIEYINRKARELWGKSKNEEKGFLQRNQCDDINYRCVHCGRCGGY